MAKAYGFMVRNQIPERMWLSVSMEISQKLVKDKYRKRCNSADRGQAE
jgi:hypothetical protein